MTALIANVVQSTDSFGQWLAKTNQLITVISNTAVTTNSNTAVGNAAITGTFISGSSLISNTGSLRIGTGTSNAFMNATTFMIRSSATANTIITDTGVYLSGTVFYTDAVASIGNSSIRSANVTADNIILKNSLRLGNTYLSTSRANTNQIYAINSALVGDSQANTYLTRDGLQIFRADTPPVTPGAGFTNANMTYDTLTIKNINANTINARTLNISGSATEFPGNTHFLGQNNYFRFGLTSNANIELINGRIGIGTTDPSAPLHITSTGAGTGILVESTESGAGTAPDIVFRRSSSSPAALDNLAGIYWQGRNSAATNLNYASLISEIASPTAGTEGTNVLLTQKVAGVDTTTLYISSLGNVGIGETAPGAPLHIKTPSAGSALIVESTESGTSTGPDIRFRRSSASPLAGDNLAGILWQGNNSNGSLVDYAILRSEIASPTAGSEGTNVFLVQKVAGANTRTLHINSAGNVGLGTTNPTQKLHVVGGALITGAATVSGVLTAGSTLAVAGAATVTGATTLNSTLTVSGASTYNGQGDFTALQNVGTLRTSSTSLGGIEVRSASNNDAAFMTFHKPGNYASYFGLDTDNYFAVGGWSAGAALANFKCNIFSASGAITAGGNITSAGNIIAYSGSDERLKENITNISNPLEKLALLNGVTFDWKDSYIESQGGLDAMFVRKNDVGIIAQDLEKVLPQLVAERSDGYKAVKYDRIVALLIEAVKELKAEIDSLKNGN